ncbi:twin-arginine translocation signal domain-containing protein [Azospirillum cavernae]|uniref:Twin-arginine translocation signal domain-containing protein n=1 Tax=Azospirillum cavernae TaxID=2320860 RepID=A0A418VPC9_9PROT|nr:twin-arginine translocation signal domain-containing protein [Azospirillum cavernae]RJF78122.1 twin-arginine translocation signal domain-containing protein [Azospirillum cavernae]
MMMLETKRVASFPIAMLQNKVALREFDEVFHSYKPSSISSSKAPILDISRRNFVKSAGFATGLLVVGTGTFTSREAEAFIPALLLAMIGIFSVATLWSVEEPASGRIALLNDSDKSQNGRVDINAFNNISLHRAHRLPIDEWRRISSGQPRIFSGSSPYEVAPRTADIYDIYGMRSSVRTNNLLVAAETSRDYSSVPGISVV